jgi:nitrite reductase/ring-hydroxylating ferredoxin subunit
MNKFDRIWVCFPKQLGELGYRRIEVIYAGETITVVVFKYQGQYLAYRNLCVHMPRELDCLQDVIFDATGRYLRCSMHGIVYDPLTGKSVSSICNGEQLTPIVLVEDEQGLWIEDRRVQPINHVPFQTLHPQN